MTLKSGVMGAKNSALPSQEYILETLRCKTDILNCIHISQYYCFYCIVVNK